MPKIVKKSKKVKNLPRNCEKNDKNGKMPPQRNTENATVSEKCPKMNNHQSWKIPKTEKNAQTEKMRKKLEMPEMLKKSQEFIRIPRKRK